MSRCRGGVVRATEAFLRRGGRRRAEGGGGESACVFVGVYSGVGCCVSFGRLSCAVVLRFVCVVLCKRPLPGTCRIIADNDVVVALSWFVYL